MQPPKINDRKLLRMVDQGKTQVEVGKFFGVSKQAVNKRLKVLRGKTTKIVATKKIEQVVDQKIDAIGQLQKINSDANEILNLLMRWNRGDKEALRILESQVRYVKVNGQEEPVKTYKMKDPRELALKAMGEIRNQLKLQLEIFQALYSLQEVEEFQKTVVEVLGEVSPEMRDEFVRKLNAKPSVRAALRYS